jgi:small redox-active disulfide protein 2
MLTIKVLGGGCAKCEKLEAEARAALDAMSPVPAYEVIKVKDYADIMTYGVMQTPALVINEQVLVEGRIPKRDQIAAWAQEAGEA